MLVMPLIRGEELLGLFELFSSQPQAFGERDERTLEALAARIFISLERAATPPTRPAAAPIPAQSEAVERNIEVPVPTPVSISHDRQSALQIATQVTANSAPADATAPGRITEHAATTGLLAADWVSAEPTRHSSDSGVEVLTWALRGAVLVCAIVLGLLLGRHLPEKKTVVHATPPPTVKAPESANPPANPVAPPEKQEVAEAAPPPPAPARSVAKEAPAGSLRIFENGKEIFNMPPAQNGASQNTAESVERASAAEPDNSIAPLSPVAAGTLLYRVEPEYPEDARRQGIEGAVVLDVHIGGDGAVQNAQLVSGPAQLAQTSIGAVKQWRFQPRRVNGRAATMQTRVTLNFKLPQ